MRAVEAREPSAAASWGLAGGNGKVDSHLATLSDAIRHVDEKKH